MSDSKKCATADSSVGAARADADLLRDALSLLRRGHAVLDRVAANATCHPAIRGDAQRLRADYAALLGLVAEGGG